MADAIPPIKVSIIADTSGLKTGVEQASKGIKDLETNVKTASGGMSSFITKLKTVGTTLGVAFAGQQILKFGKDVVMAASDMNESLSKTQVIFGNAFDEINKFSDTSATKMGMSKQAALDASSTFALFGQSAGLSGTKVADFSTQMVQLSADFASFYNTSPQDAITAIGAAFRGENEPIRRYNILLDDASTRQEALRLGIVKTTKDALTPQQRVLAVQSLILKQSTVAQGDFERTASGTANTMRILSAQFEAAKVALGDALMPAFRAILGILKILIPVLKALGDFFKKYIDDIMAVSKVVMIGVAAFYAYRAVMAITAATSTFLAVATTLLKGQQLASIASTNGLAASMLALNAAMRANPVGLIVTGITLAIAAIVLLWKHSESFRKLVITVGKAGLMAFASIIPMVGQVFEAIMKVTTGPLRLLLTALSHLPGVGKYAKAGLDIMNTGLNKISDFADGASKKAKELAAGLDNLGKKADTAGKKTKDAVAETTKTTTTTTKPGGIDAKTKEKLDGLVKKAVGIQKDMQDAINEANEKAQEALNNRNEKMAEANKNYLEREAELNKNYKEAMAEAQKRYDETKIAEDKKKSEAELAALKKFNEKKSDIQKTYDEKTAALTKDYTEKVAEIRAKAEQKSIDLTKAAAEKRQSIIQQSIDRLRGAFASKTAFDVGESLAGGGGVSSLLEKMKKQLLGAKTLQQNAAALAGKGYTQTFIEQIVKQGPEMGNTIAEELLKASDASTKEMQSLYSNIETISEHGMDTLAATMNSGGKLATEELMKSFNQVGTDLAEALSEVNQEMNASLAQTLKDYNEKTAEAEKIRKEALADANKDYQETMAEVQKNYTEAMAEALKTMEEARAAAKKTLDEGLAEAQKTLMEALTNAQKDYEKAIDEINKATMKKLADLKAKLAEIVALIAAISAAQAAAVVSATPTYTPIVPVTAPVTAPVTGSTGTTTNINTTVTGVNLTDPTTTTATVVNAIKYGSAVMTYQQFTAQGAGASGGFSSVVAAAMAQPTQPVAPAPRNIGAGKMSQLERYL